MRIGILTYHSSYNFGANLQTLATQSALEKCGLEPVVINYQEPDKMSVYRRNTCPDQAKIHEEFLEKYIKLSPLLSSSREVQDFCKSALDVVLVGSDAVFRLVPKYELTRWLRRILLGAPMSTYGGITERLPAYWLDWQAGGHGERRIYKASIAASATGTKFYLLKWSLYPELRRAINHFDIMTVRDRWTKLMVSCLSLGRKVPSICPDPVMALPRNFEVPESEQPQRDMSKMILVSGRFPQEWLQTLTREARKRGFKVANLPNPDDAFENECFDHVFRLPMSPLSWYSLLASSAGFIGVRFHALVSCLGNCRPVVAVDPRKRHDLCFKLRSRVADLCRRAGVLDRYFTEKQIVRIAPAEVLDTLFEPRSLKKAAQYSEHAQKAFAETITSVLEGAKKAI
jgi:hypothetical protein